MGMGQGKSGLKMHCVVVVVVVVVALSEATNEQTSKQAQTDNPK